MSQEPNQADQPQPPYPNYGYQSYDQQQTYPSYNPQLGYSVPATTDNNTNAPNRWRRWVGYNALAFGLSCVIMPLGCCVMSVIASVLRNSLQELVDNHTFNLVGAIGVFVLLSFPLFLTMGVASMIQRSALYHQVPAKLWVFGSALTGIAAMFVAIMLMGMIAALFALDFTPNTYILSIVVIFAGTSTGIGFFQWWQIRRVVINAWHWPLISGATWTGLGTLMLGVGMSYLYNRLGI